MTTTPTPRIVVALDGPASSGKSSVGAAAAARLGLRFVDTGIFYRALTALALREGVAPDDGVALAPMAARVALGDDGSGVLSRVLLDGRDATDELRSDAVDAAVSTVARIPEVRAALLQRQRDLTAGGGIIVAGRDIGTVVLPDAGLKLFLDASVEERANRRIAQRGLDPQGEEAALVREQLGARDAQDRGREVAPLVAAADAVHVNSDGIGFDATVDQVVAAVTKAESSSVPAPESASAKAERSPRPERAERAEKPDRSDATGDEPGAKRNRKLEIAMRMDNHRTWLTTGFSFLCRCFARAVCSVQFEGLDNLPKDGPAIIAINHISSLDALVAGAWINEHIGDRRMHWLGKRSLFDIPVFGWMIAYGGVHPVDRGNADVEAYRLASRLLKAGFVLIVYPEGTRSPDGALQEAKDGVAMLAMGTGAPIVPVGVNDADLVWRKGRALPSPFPRRKVTVRFGKPFTVAEVLPKDVDRKSAKGLATRAIMGRIAALLDPRHRGIYADDAAAQDTPTA